MKEVRLGRKEFRRRFGDADGMTERYQGTEPTIYFPGRPSTKERLHEVYHATESPNLEEIEKGKKWQTSDELHLEELRAQWFAAEYGGHEGEVPWNMIMSVAKVGLGWGHRPATIMGSIKRALEEEGFEPLDREHRSELWSYLRETYESERGSNRRKFR